MQRLLTYANLPQICPNLAIDLRRACCILQRRASCCDKTTQSAAPALQRVRCEGETTLIKHIESNWRVHSVNTPIGFNVFD